MVLVRELRHFLLQPRLLLCVQSAAGSLLFSRKKFSMEIHYCLCDVEVFNYITFFKIKMRI